MLLNIPLYPPLIGGINEMVMIIKQCAICKDNINNYTLLYNQNFDEDEITKKTFSARRTTEHFHYTILRCNQCGLILSSPIFEKERLFNLYLESEQNYDYELENIASSYAFYLNDIKRYLPSTETVLEIGCGSGFFLEKAQEFGFKNIFGVEPSRHAVEKSKIKSSIKNCFFDSNDYPQGYFDLICSFQTLDHMDAPLNVLTGCLQILKPGGIIYFITHNTDSLQARVLNDKSPIIDVEHTYLFNKKTLSKIFQLAGLSVLKVFDVKNTYTLGYWVRMTPLPLKNLIIGSLIKTGLSNINISINAGNIGIMAKRY